MRILWTSNKNILGKVNKSAFYLSRWNLWVQFFFWKKINLSIFSNFKRKLFGLRAVFWQDCQYCFYASRWAFSGNFFKILLIFGHWARFLGILGKLFGRVVKFVKSAFYVSSWKLGSKFLPFFLFSYIFQYCPESFAHFLCFFRDCQNSISYVQMKLFRKICFFFREKRSL